MVPRDLVCVDRAEHTIATLEPLSIYDLYKSFSAHTLNGSCRNLPDDFGDVVQALPDRRPAVLLDDPGNVLVKRVADEIFQIWSGGRGC